MDYLRLAKVWGIDEDDIQDRVLYYMEFLTYYHPDEELGKVAVDNMTDEIIEELVN